MVIINVNVEGTKKPLYMDGQLYHQLADNVRPSVQKKDFDYVICVDGEEGSGKSVLAQQIAKVLDPSFDLSKVCFTPDEFIRAIVRAKKNDCIVFDEAFTGLSSRSSLSEMNQLLVSLMMEMRQRNLFVIIVMPSFFMLDKYCALHRSKVLFHVYLKEGKRGYWFLYNKPRMKYLYLNGKKFYDYNTTRPIIFGRFQDQYTINEEGYRQRKSESLTKKKRETKAAIYKMQRDTFIYICYMVFHKSQQEISDMLKEYDIIIERSTIRDILMEMRKQITLRDALKEDKPANTAEETEEMAVTPTKNTQNG